MAENLFTKLKKLFSSDVVVRSIGGKKLKVVDSDLLQSLGLRTNYATDRFTRVFQPGSYSYNAQISFQTSRLQLYNDYECLGGDTVIPTPDGKNLTIYELSKIYDSLDKKFYVYSYDHKTNSIKIGVAHSVRKTKTDMTYKITFDDGSHIIATENHPFLMRDGEYKQVKDLLPNESIMPFYQYVTSTINHKIISIEPYKIIDVYDMTVDEYHNFATKNCFVHNCMDQDAILASALDIISDESTTKNEYGDILAIKAEDDAVLGILRNLFYDILNIEFNLWMWIRNMCKYGNQYLKLDISEKYGVVNITPIPVYECTREEMFDKDKPHAVRFIVQGIHAQGKLENYEIADFRLLTDSNFLPYGKSYFEIARKVWKQLCLHKNTRIWTNTGYKRIEDIKSGDSVYSFDYNTGNTIETRVKNCTPMGRQDTYKVMTNHRQIITTDNHGLLVCDKNGKFSYKKTKDLICREDQLVLPKLNQNETRTSNIKMKSDDYCVKLKSKVNYSSSGIIKQIRDLHCETTIKNIHAFLNGLRKIRFSDYLKLKSQFDISESDVVLYLRHTETPSICKLINDEVIFELDGAFVEFFGFMLGDGWLHKNGCGFALGIYDDINNKYIDYIQSLGVRHSIRYGKRGVRGGVVDVFSKDLNTILKMTGFISGFRNKIVPNWAFELNSLDKINFLTGIFNADGSYKDGRLGMCNYQVVESCMILAQQCGVPTNKLNFKNDYGPERKLRFVKYLNEWKNRFTCYRLKLDVRNPMADNYILETVNKVIFYEENSETWDLEVENELHNFVADGIISHNTLLEDAMLIHRIMRAPEKRIFKIDIGNIPPNEVDQYMQKIIDKMKKTPYIDPQTGDYNLKFNMMNMTEDFYLPTRGGETGTSVDSLKGLEFNAIDDVEYIKHKMMAALKIPKAFLGFEEGIGAKCLHPDTKIPLLNGDIKTIKEIADEFTMSGDPNWWVYSYDVESDSIIPTKIKLAEQTRKNAELVRVTLDNGEYVICTPDHHFVLRGDAECQAQNLTAGDSLQTVYRRKVKLAHNANEYEQVYQPNSNTWKWTHKMVDEHVNGLIVENGHSSDGRFDRNNLVVVHHNDFNRYNNNPNNLVRMKFDEHINLHRNNCVNVKAWTDRSKLNKLPENRLRSSNIQKERIKNNPKLAYTLAKAWQSMTFEERSEITKRGWTPGRIQITIDTNKKHNKAEKMMVAYKKKYRDGRYDMMRELNPRWRERPTLLDIEEFIAKYPDKQEINHFVRLSRKMGIHNSILKEVVEKSGLTIIEFMNTRVGHASGRTKTITKEKLIELVSGVNSIKEFKTKFNFGRRAFSNLLMKNNMTVSELQNYVGATYNHKVVSVEFLNEKIDTYNLEVDNKNHNYFINSGVIIKNSTLSAEDVRFSRTIERIQRIVVTELTKIAIIHLYSQGITDERLVNFELSLTNPSTIAEQEKLALWETKIRLANEAASQNPAISSDWIYTNVFGFSDDQIKAIRTQLIEDKKREFRYTQIAGEGNDPLKTGQSFGTPHDLASLNLSGKDDESIDYGETNFNPESPNVISPEIENNGRPPEGSKYGQDSHIRGRDPLGAKELQKSLELDTDLKHNFKGGNPLYREQVEFRKKLDIKTKYESALKLIPDKFKKTSKRLVESITTNDDLSETTIEKDSFLNEKNIIDVSDNIKSE